MADNKLGSLIGKNLQRAAQTKQSGWMNIPIQPAQAVGGPPVGTNQAGLDSADALIMKAPSTFEELQLDMKLNPQKYQR